MRLRVVRGKTARATAAPRGRVRRSLNAAAAVLTSVVLLGVLAVGYGPVPALGSALDPGAGVWDSVDGAKAVGPRTVSLPGMRDPVTVTLNSAGVPAVRARSDADLFQAEGYLHAYFRLAQLDIVRRTATGRLSELQGAAGVDSDTFELQSGLSRTAEAIWKDTAPGSAEAEALRAYSRGVNARLAELRRSGRWPAVFALTGVHPRDWTPVDSLSVQLLWTQSLDYNISPLVYSVLEKALGPERTTAWFPVMPPNPQRPYDPGPYRNLGIDPLPASANTDAAVPDGGDRATAASPAPSGSPAGKSASRTNNAAGTTDAAAALLSRIQSMPQLRINRLPDSNAWAANGPAVAGGGALLAGDPHLQTPLPAFWYQIALSAPETDVSGGSVPGMPGVAIGRNRSISWSMTDAENQSTLFYAEKTSPDHPGQYYWRGAWRTMQQIHYTIPVRGGSTVPLTVDLTVHGPVMTETEDITGTDQVYSATWMGDYVSHSLKALLAVDKAKDYQQFRSALADWHAPTLNFAFASGSGDIGVVAAGYFPQVAAGDPWKPLPGTGEYDISGVIPYAAAPQAYNPAGHVLATANQRPVGADYPYYLGTSMDAFDIGYRADRIYEFLEDRQGMTAADFGALQNDVRDHLATLIVPRLQQALKGAALDAREQAALGLLSGWDFRMTESSAAASVWWTFWSDYVSGVFQPWWDAAKVPVDQDSEDLKITERMPALTEDLQVWTLNDPHNAAFSPPGGAAGDADGAMRAAFAKTVSDLSGQLGGAPDSWTWGRIHTRELPALTGAPGLGYGPAPAAGDHWTVDAAEGGLNSTFGPSWRMVVAWSGPGHATASAVYPGGQSEDPLSPWYETFVADWWHGRLRPLGMADAAPGPGAVEWTLRPGKER